jgi:hypothetical protein
MKKHLLLFVSFCISIVVCGQTIPGGHTLKKASNMEIIRNYRTNPVLSSSRAVDKTFVLDYDAVDGEYANVTTTDYARFVWNVNKRYPNDSSFVTRWGAVVFDTLFDFTSNPTYPFDRYPTAASQITIDSLYIFYGHFNTTGMMDTLVITIYKNDTLNTITNVDGIRAEVVWTDTIYTDSSLTGPGTGGSPVTLGQLTYAPNVVLPRGSTFSVQMDYYGPVNDECFFLAGYRDACADACGGMLSQVGSRFGSGENSFSLFVYKPATGAGFQALNHGVTIDCNSNGTIEDNLCENFYIQNIAFTPIVTVNVNPSGNILAERTEGCPGQTSVLDLSHYGFTGTPTFSWAPATGLSSTTVEDPTLTIPASGTTTYTCTITSGADVATASVTVKSNGITVNAGADQTIACGATANVAATIGGITTGPTYAWSNGKTTAANSGVVAGVYTVTVSNNKGCTATDGVEVRYPGVTQTVGFSIPSPICANKTVIFPNTSAKKTGWNWTWTNGTTSATSFLENGELTFPAAGPSTVRLEADSAGCKFSTTAAITVRAATDPLCVVGINDINFDNNVSIYPNPNDGTFELNVEGIDAELSINVVDMNGKVVYTENTSKVSSFKKAINLGSVAGGVYFVKVQSGENTAIKKLVIN